jgi:hypothetical protein
MCETGQVTLGVIIPVFVNNIEGETQLYRALGSISRQSRRPSEVILTLDNPEPDDSLFTRLRGDFSELNISVVKNLKLRGISSNSNNGMRLVQSNYIHILHQDDWLIDTNVYQEIADYLHTHTDCFFLLPWKRLESFSKPTFDLTALLGNNRFGGPSGIIFPSDSSIFFDERLSMLCDVDFVFQLHKKFGRPKVFEKVVLEYGVSTGQAQNLIGQDEFSRELHTIFAKHKPNKWKILSIALLRYKSEDIYAMVKNLERIGNSFIFSLFVKIVVFYSRVVSRLRRMFT